MGIKLPKQKFIYDKDRSVPLGVKNANPYKYGFPSATSIPGNENGIKVPCTPYDDFDGDRRWSICESNEKAIELLDLYIKDYHKQDEDSRCVILRVGVNGNLYGVKCRKKCEIECPKRIDPNNPENSTEDYKRTGNPTSLDFIYDETDAEESEHDIADSEDVSPSEYCNRLDEEKRVQEFINGRDKLDRKIIELLLINNKLSERKIGKILHVSDSTIHKRLVKIRAEIKDKFKK